jgi:hypothetical protein
MSEKNDKPTPPAAETWEAMQTTCRARGLTGGCAISLNDKKCSKENCPGIPPTPPAAEMGGCSACERVNKWAIRQHDSAAQGLERNFGHSKRATTTYETKLDIIKELFRTLRYKKRSPTPPAAERGEECEGCVYVVKGNDYCNCPRLCCDGSEYAGECPPSPTPPAAERGEECENCPELEADIKRLRSERDEARTEGDRLRSAWAALQAYVQLEMDARKSLCKDPEDNPDQDYDLGWIAAARDIRDRVGMPSLDELSAEVVEGRVDDSGQPMWVNIVCEDKVLAWDQGQRIWMVRLKNDVE